MPIAPYAVRVLLQREVGRYVVDLAVLRLDGHVQSSAIAIGIPIPRPDHRVNRVALFDV